MGMQAVDPGLMSAHNGARSGPHRNGARWRARSDQAPTDSSTADPDNDGVTNEVPTSLVDFMESTYSTTSNRRPTSRAILLNTGAEFQQIGCAQCHVPELLINYDRRVADEETNYDPVNGLSNHLCRRPRRSLVER